MVVSLGGWGHHVRAWSTRRTKCTLRYSTLIRRMRPLCQSTVIRADFRAWGGSDAVRKRIIVVGYPGQVAARFRCRLVLAGVAFTQRG